jgi:hypothetical protein
LSETTGGRCPRYPQRCVLRLHSFERRPAAVFFVAAGPLLAGVVEQPLPDFLPDCVLPVEPDGVDLLDLDGPPAESAGDAQQVLRYLRQPPLTGFQTAGEGLGP